MDPEYESGVERWAWERIAQTWGIAPEGLPKAVEYLYTLLLVEAGELELVEVQYRAEGERHVYRSTAPAAEGGLTAVDRPRGWNQQDELRALDDLLEAFRMGNEEAEEEKEVPATGTRPAPALETAAVESAGQVDSGGPPPESTAQFDATCRRTMIVIHSAEQTADGAWSSLRAAQAQIGRSTALLRLHRTGTGAPSQTRAA